MSFIARFPTIFAGAGTASAAVSYYFRSRAEEQLDRINTICSTHLTTHHYACEKRINNADVYSEGAYCWRALQNVQAFHRAGVDGEEVGVAEQRLGDCERRSR
jgi:hypothetical protein